MPSHTSLNTFAFSDKIDSKSIHEMYENDLPYIETIFKTILDHFNEDLSAICNGYQQQNLEGLRRSIHKVRPTFGFAGMPGLQEKCREFESKCQAAASINEIQIDFENLVKDMEEAEAIIKEEYGKLKSFNEAGS